MTCQTWRTNTRGILILALTTLLLPFYADAADDDIDFSLKDVSTNLVLISYEVGGKEKHGNGVVVQMDDKPYLLTNQHIILGAGKLTFITASGTRLAPRSVELCTNRDLARLSLAEGSGLTLSTTTKMGTPVAVFSGGNGRAENIEYGEIIGVGGPKFEVSAEFSDDSIGAPALNAKKEVVGIAGYSQTSARHAMKTGTRFDEAERHFCYRIGKAQWKKVNWKAYNGKYGKAYREHRAFCDDLLEMFEEDRHHNLSAKRAGELATQCRVHARQMRNLTEQRDLTAFLRTEFEDQAEMLEFVDEFLSDYAKANK